MPHTTKRLYFYAPGDHFHLAPLDMYVVSKISVRENGIHWLEPVWSTGLTPDKNGLLLFTSKLDALICAFVLNKSSGESWNVYSFNDVSVTEMMIDVASITAKYHIHIAFCFSIDNKECLLFKNDNLKIRSFIQSFTIEKEMSALSPITLKFNKSYFDEINFYWEQCYQNYCESIKKQNLMDNSLLMNIALEAIKKMNLSKIDKVNDCDCISHYSIDKQKWIISFN
ncbi:hypothetical protein [Rahnella sp. CG8]|jgi:hypothetical protein|uniref:hypothetical protein n=1 Tax=Rahnella sp. CG8 TaxID=2726078 RepID=UPI002033A656|nr:hypothetical protein [Rahnella sp. CG8]MCM2445066.1 hypothetical protein [Rahnella sp. CG8]